MAIPTGLVYADHVKQLSITTGTGDMALGAAAPQSVTFAAAGISVGARVSYVIQQRVSTTNEWEVGYGTLIDASTLQRDTVTSSTNASAKVDFSAGTKLVALTLISDTLTELLAGATGIRGVAIGGTGADLSLTSGLLRQASAGAAFTATQLQAADVPNGLITNAMITSVAASKLTGILGGVNGGLGADASAFAGLIKIAAGVASVATAETDYVTPSGSGTLANKTLTTPTIASFANANHTHQNAAGGGTLTTAAIASGTFADSFIPNLAASKITSGDMAAARIAVALAGGTLPISATTIAGSTGTFSGDVTLSGAPGKIKPTANSTSALQIANAAGTGFVNFDTTNSRLGINTILPTASLDVSDGSLAIVIGANNFSPTRTNNTTKAGRFGAYHYVNLEEPVGLISYSSSSTENIVNLGGGSSILNAANVIGFYTASNTTTVTGTERMRIDSAGDITLSDGTDFIINTTTGTKFGTSVSQKMGWWNATPVVQPASAAQVSVVTTAATNIAPYGFATQAQADAIVTLVNELRRSLVLAGLIKGAA
jgi:hypothetical protein